MGIIDLNPSQVYENGLFHSLDTTHNVPMGGNWNIQNNWEYIQNSILVSKQNPRFEPHIYNSKTNKGIEFRGGQTTSKNRLIFYGKEIELNRPKNREFFKACSNPMAVLNQSINLLRVESNNTSHKDIKERFGVNTMRVRDILNSKKMPTLDMLNKITIPGKANQLSILFESNTNADIKEIAMIYGFENIIRDANYHIPTIKAFVKMYTTNSMFKHWWYGGKQSTMSIRELIHKTQEKDFGVSNQNNAVMEHIKNSILDDYKRLKTAS
jgi:antitoxin component HigA of HigAB toxin-antitoxin module